MTIEVDIPDYLPDEVIDIPFTQGSVIEGYRSIHSKAIEIRANKEGLYSLAMHLLELSQDCVPTGSHIHYDKGYLMEITSNSEEIIIAKI